MTDASGSGLPPTDVTAGTPSGGASRLILTIATKIPVTLSIVALLLIVGVASAGLWSPFELSSAWDVFAYGLPAFEAGRWWTPVTGTFFVNQPWVYALTITSFWGLAYLEYRRGSRVALAYFTIGQLFSVLATAVILWVFALTPWPWAQLQSQMLDVGPSGGAFAGIAAAVGLFVAPWRVRGWAVLLSFLFVALVFWGNIADLSHVLAVVLVLAVDRTLRVRRTTMREQRLIAYLALLVLGAIEILALLLPTNGPFGSSASGSGSIWDVALDVVVIVLVANGLRHGRRWAWVVSVILAIVNLLTGALILLVVALAGWDETRTGLDGDPTVSLASSATWLLMFAYLIWVRGAFRARRKASVGTKPSPTVDEVKNELRAFGGGTLSWMTTWDGNTYFRSSTGMLAYQRRAGVAIVLGDPIGPEEGRAQTIAEFIEAIERAALIPAFFSVGEATRSAVPSDWRSVVVADDTIVDLPQLEFTGKRWNSVRTALNKAGREEMTFRLSRLRDETWGVQQQLRAISEMWVGDKGLPEMGFTLGTLDEAADPEVRLALAISPKGDIDGFLSWLPIYGGGGVIRGWTLDLMRRREGGFGPVMEFLIGGSARDFRDEGAQIVSLSGAPLTHEYPADAGIIKDLTDRVADALEPVYGFRSLHRFKEKFHPRYETMYLLFRDESDLTRIGAGLTRAFLPDATLRQFAGAGLELVRGKD